MEIGDISSANRTLKYCRSIIGGKAQTPFEKDLTSGEEKLSPECTNRRQTNLRLVCLRLHAKMQAETGTLIAISIPALRQRSLLHLLHDIGMV